MEISTWLDADENSAPVSIRLSRISTRRPSIVFVEQKKYNVISCQLRILTCPR
jgi:hypothetical protein